MHLKIVACYVSVYLRTFVNTKSFINLLPCKCTCVQTGKLKRTGMSPFDTYQVYVANHNILEGTYKLEID